MKYSVSIILLVSILLCLDAFSQMTPSKAHVAFESPISNDTAPPKGYLKLTPDFEQANMDHGYVKIPFLITNTASEEITIAAGLKEIDGLMTLENDGTRVFVIQSARLYSSQGRWFQPGGIPLKPGESATLTAEFRMKEVSALGNRKVFGVISGATFRSGETFHSDSEPFALPVKFTTEPWEEIGEKPYLKASPDWSKALIYGSGTKMFSSAIQHPESPEYLEFLNKGRATNLCIPMIIRNTGPVPVAICFDEIRYFPVRNKGKMPIPEHWKTVNASWVLKPGESATADASFVRVSDLEAQNYKRGEKIFAEISGRIPDTNQVFESYSEPFDLPPLPPSDLRKRIEDSYRKEK